MVLPLESKIEADIAFFPHAFQFEQFIPKIFTSSFYFTGGIILGNYLTRAGDAAKGKIVAAMLISICWDCFEGTTSLEKKGINLMLNRHLANCLTQSIKEVTKPRKLIVHFLLNGKRASCTVIENDFIPSKNTMLFQTLFTFSAL